jgi:hypothetical protein
VLGAPCFYAAPMDPLRAASVLLCVLAGACRRETPPPTVTEPRAEARDAASIDASTPNSTPDATRVEAGADSGADAANDAVIERPTGLRPSAFVLSGFEDRALRAPAAATPATARSGRAPSLGAAVAMLRARRSSAARFVPEGGFNALGDGRFALVVQRFDPGAPRSPAFEVHVFSESEGAAQLEGSAQVPTTYLYLGENGATGCAPAILAREVRDFDDDDEPELSLIIRYCLRASCSAGYVAMEYHAIYDVTPGPSLAALVERRWRGQDNMHSARTRVVSWRDVNGDGHPDLVARGRDCEPDIDRIFAMGRGEHDDEQTDLEAMINPCPRPERGCPDNPTGLRICVARDEVALYDPATDAWRAGTDGAEPLIEPPCGE